MLQRGGQLFEVHYDEGGVNIWISVIFRYSQDELKLHIEDVTIEFG